MIQEMLEGKSTKRNTGNKMENIKKNKRLQSEEKTIHLTTKWNYKISSTSRRRYKQKYKKRDIKN